VHALEQLERKNASKQKCNKAKMRQLKKREKCNNAKMRQWKK
jgi:hypothetical protein